MTPKEIAGRLTKRQSHAVECTVRGTTHLESRLRYRLKELGLIRVDYANGCHITELGKQVDAVRRELEGKNENG